MSTDNLEKKKRNSAFGCYYYNYVSDGTKWGHCFASPTRDGTTILSPMGSTCTFISVLVIFRLRILVLLQESFIYFVLVMYCTYL